MAFAACPICDVIVPLTELERHANNHFEEEELAKDLKLSQQIARDMELAQQIALRPTSPRKNTDNRICSTSSFQSNFGDNSESGTSRCNSKTNDDAEISIPEKISCLVNLQLRSFYYKVEGSLMALLRRCLELERENSTCILSSYIDHFQSVESEDRGWGCGWRNIQMLSSHLLMQRQEAKEVLFGGSGFVPDIASLQRWLEIAWQRGFDIDGSNSLKNEVYGTNKWIGTTECAALFRSFGIRARIVDFGSKELESLYCGGNRGAEHVEMNSEAKRKVEQVYGPMDNFLQGRNLRRQQQQPITTGPDSQTRDSPSTSTSGYSNGFNGSAKSNKYGVKNIKGHDVLVDWVWNYFANEEFSRLDNHQRVTISKKTPLYFQHQGHSRTIVGIQRKQPQDGSKQYTLLILDPGHKTKALEWSLKQNFGWQKLIKRGVHTLKKPQYQLCYIDQGIANEKETEQMKTIDSIFFEA
ncbi:hypothetical protein C5167_031903 [Papaver somniferum]|uniref:UFSP1/2/DUB catalytic domain-containing protein n=1 Tax=Papaver somniferum TaxID=3469 RepID=A0A4Y7K5N8_PAPSO|nr:zinc finger-containing ubiquitin peptidase 1-like isoform X1 [Papaver somniferum]XP_026400787.1 zinc finger-containing ubiquitin peptidase 1-like isoform X1 [Papaver somniferum]XP_026400788.1 zinc finger-containing ubiquitin peptidase 1-like isoform X2 [Papaver somniferum]RZC68664.1 hypothetical protein C5167_031903 [Papaver somniferum]